MCRVHTTSPKGWEVCVSNANGRSTSNFLCSLWLMCTCWVGAFQPEMDGRMVLTLYLKCLQVHKNDPWCGRPTIGGFCAVLRWWLMQCDANPGNQSVRWCMYWQLPNESCTQSKYFTSKPPPPPHHDPSKVGKEYRLASLFAHLWTDLFVERLFIFVVVVLKHRMKR